MLPMAPAKISEKQTIDPVVAFVLTRCHRYQPIPLTSAILNTLKKSLPKDPPNSSPKAMPLFSVKWMMNHSPAIWYSWPRNMFVLIQNLTAWSASKNKKIMSRGRFNALSLKSTFATLRRKRASFYFPMPGLIKEPMFHFEPYTSY